jgi:antitoxin ParD1/3/4
MDRELTIILSDEAARLIEERVQSGAFPSAAAVIGAALDTLAETEAREQRETEWLRTKVQEALDDPRPPVPADEAFARVRNHISGREALRGAKS